MPTCLGEGNGSFFACLTICRSTFEKLKPGFEKPKPGNPGDDCQDWQPANAKVSTTPTVSRDQILCMSSFIAVEVSAVWAINCQPAVAP